MILLIWLVAPFAEAGVIIGLAVTNGRHKKRIQELTCQLERQRLYGFERKRTMEGEMPPNLLEPESTNPPEPGSPNPSEPESTNLPEPEIPSDEWLVPGYDGRRAVKEAEEKPGQRYVEGPVEETIEGLMEETMEGTVSSAMKVTEVPAGIAAAVMDPTSSNTKPDSPARIRKADSHFYQGTAALIIGVVFVVLAGLIFATTAWHVLPSYCKVIMVLGFSGLFFGSSLVAGKILKIQRTSQAFYILGSIFLFLTILAAGYFGLIGPEFILKGQNRYRVLWVGSMVTEIAMLAGTRKFRDRLYTQSCFWGMTVSMTFLMGALGLGYAGCLNAMVYYSFLLLLWDEGIRRRQDGAAARFSDKYLLPEFMEAGFSFFVNLHFWIFSGLMALAAITGWMTGMTGFSLLGIVRITPWSTLALGLTTAGISLKALRDRRMEMRVLHSVSMAAFFQYAGLCLPFESVYQIFAGAVLTGGWFLAERKKGSPLCSQAGGCVLTAVLAIDTLMLLAESLYWHDLGTQAAVSAAVLLLAAVTAWWGRQYPVLREIIPVILYALTMTAGRALAQIPGFEPRYDVIVFAYILIMAVWDVLRRDRFGEAILVIGTAAQILFQISGQKPLPFFILLAVYLLIWSFRKDGKLQEWYVKGSCLYSLAGVYILAGSLTDNGVAVMMWVTFAYGAEYAVMCCRDRSQAGTWFWDGTGLAVFLCTMAAFYWNPGLSAWNLVPCLASFAVFYVMFYRRGNMWLHLAAAIAVLPLPLAAALRYGWTGNQACGFTGAAALISGILFRYYRPILRQRENVPAAWDVDWFHILVILPLVSLALDAGRGWRCAYTVLAALYVLQYAAVKPLRKGSLTIASALAVLAFWIQPYIQWPDLIRLEVQLAPAALFSWSLARIWKDEACIPWFQTAICCLCLGAMILDAFYTGNVGDALILEAVCLVIFLWAHVRKCVRWFRISGIIIVTVALYMTKGFWLSLSWWVYLLAAGLGLIIFAASTELKKH